MRCSHRQSPSVRGFTGACSPGPGSRFVGRSNRCSRSATNQGRARPRTPQACLRTPRLRGVATAHAPLRRGARRARRARGRQRARRALRPRRPGRLRHRLPRSSATSGSPRTPCRRLSRRLAHRRGRSAPERAKASTWILTLVHRRAVDLVRREERRRTEPLDADALPDAPDPSGSAEDEAWLGFERDRVQAALAHAARRAARGDRARLLRRLLAVRARREARGSRSVRSRAGCSPGSRACASSSTTPRPRRIMDAEIHELTAGYALDALDARTSARATRSTSPTCEALPARSSLVLGGRRARSAVGHGRARAAAASCASGSSTRARASRRTSSRSTNAAARSRPVLAAAARSPPCAAIALGLWAPRSRRSSTTRGRRSRESAPQPRCSRDPARESSLDRATATARRRTRTVDAVLVARDARHPSRRARPTRSG